MVHVATPPDPRPHKPMIECPPGSVDTHFHLFGSLADYPFVANTPYLTGEALPESIIKMHDTIGISAGVIVSGGAYGRSTRYLADTLSRYPARFRGVVVPSDSISQDEIKRLDEVGVRGVRFVSDKGGAHVAQILPEVARAVADRGWHVQFMANGTNLPEHSERLLALPNNIVIDHFGSVDATLGTDQPAFRTLLKMLDTGRVWVKLSGPMYCSKLEFPYADVQPFADALVRYAPERLLWGSDWPHLHMFGRNMPNDGDLVDLLLDWVPDRRKRDAVLADNPRRFYGFNA